MPLIFADHRDKREMTDLLRKNLQAFLFRNLPQNSREAILEHLAWMEQQPRLNVNAKFETHPETHKTVLTLEFSHESLKPFEVRQ